MEKKAIFIVSEKGGVGKSTCAKALLDHLRRIAPAGQAEPLKVMAFDLQPKVNQLGGAYGIKAPNAAGKLAYSAAHNNMRPFAGVISASLDENSGRELIGDSLEAKADVLLFDLPGGKSESLKEVFGKLSTLVAELQAARFDIVVVMVLSFLKASAAEVGEAIAVWGPQARYVAVLNLGLANRDQFIFFDGERSDQVGEPAKLLAKAGGVVLEMPRLQADTYAEIVADEVTFSFAATDERTYKRTKRVRVRDWIEAMDAEIAKLELMPYSPEMLAIFEDAEGKKRSV